MGGITNMRALHALTRRQAVATALALGVAGKDAIAQGSVASESWPSLAAQVFDNRPILDGSALMAIDAPYRAEDAAMVPISIRALGPAGEARRIESLTLLIDENPSPLAATFSLGANSGI